MNIHIQVHLDNRPEWVKGARDSVNLTECTLILLFIFIPLDYLLHYIEELCEAGFSVITVSVFVYQTNTMSANSLLMYAVPLTFREESREDTSTHNPPRARGSLPFFFFLWYIILLCLTWSPLAVSLLLLSFGSGSYSNPFLHASDRLILSLLSCCSTWQRIMLGTPFAFQVIHNLCTFTGTYKTKQSWRLHCSQTSRKSYFLWLVANIYLLYGL